MRGTFVALSLATLALGVPFITSPTASTTCTAGQQCTINWQDDGHAPDLKTFGPARVGLFTGNSKQQTQLQSIVPSVDVSTTASIVFTPDPTVGESGAFYFIRFDSISTKDATTPANPAQSFSAIFNLAGMTGTFNATVQAQIDGTSTAPIGGSTPASAASTSAGAGASTTGASASTTGSTKPSSTSSSSSTAKATGSTKSGAGKLTVGAAGVLGVVGAVFGLVL